MNEPTDADRETASRAFSEWVTFMAGDGHRSIGRATDEERIDAIATALAEERQKARAPFLALAEELDSESANLEPYDMDTAPEVARRIRRAADDAS